jgi:hypothetical protein
VTDKNGVSSASASLQLAVRTDALAIGTGSRHRVGTEMRIEGTSTLEGNTAVLTPATAVVIYDTTAGRPVARLGTATVDTLGAWSLKVKPGPATQITNVLVQSTRGGTAAGAISTR